MFDVRIWQRRFETFARWKISKKNRKVFLLKFFSEILIFWPEFQVFKNFIFLGKYFFFKIFLFFNIFALFFNIFFIFEILPRNFDFFVRISLKQKFQFFGEILLFQIFFVLFFFKFLLYFSTFFLKTFIPFLIFEIFPINFDFFVRISLKKISVFWGNFSFSKCFCFIFLTFLVYFSVFYFWNFTQKFWFFGEIFIFQKLFVLFF